MRQIYFKLLKGVIVLLLIIITPTISFSQKIQTVVHSSSTVSTFVVKNDTIWMGTTSGIVVMNKGQEIIATYPTINNINDINFISSAIDNSNNVWFGSDKGIFMYNGEAWQNYYQGYWVLDIEVDSEGILWFATNGGILKFDGSWTSITEGLSEQIVFSIYNDSKNILWVGTNSGIDKFNGTSWVNLTTSDGLVNNDILDIAEDKSGNLWFGTASGGVSKFNGTIWQSFLQSEQIFSIKAINDTVWFGTHNGAYKYYESEILNYTTEDGLYDDYVKTIFIDDNNFIWFNNTIGLTQYNYNSWEEYAITNNLANNFVRSIAFDTINKTKWIGTDNGISVFDGLNWSTYNSADGLVANMVMDIEIDSDNNKWIATNGGISFFDGNTWTNYWQELLSNSVRSISIDSLDNIWVATHLGLNKFDGTNWSSYTTTEGIVDNNIVTTYIDGSGNLWLGTLNGVSVLSNGSWSNYTTIEGLINNKVTAIYQDSTNNMWFGSENGLSKFDGTNWTSYEKTWDNVFCLEIDRLNNLWIGTLNGVYVLEDETFIHYDEFDNLAGNNIFEIVVDVDGFKWIGCNKGLTFFNYYPECSDTSLTYDTGSNKSLTNSILLVEAIDADGNDLHYSFANESNSLGIFSIDEITGEICSTLVDTLTQNYDLEVIITDGKVSIETKVSLDFENMSNSIEFEHKLKDVKIFPNPAKELINIEISDSEIDEISIKLISIDGKLSFTKTYYNTNELIQIDLTKFRKGNYILSVKQANKIENYKLIIY